MSERTKSARGPEICPHANPQNPSLLFFSRVQDAFLSVGKLLGGSAGEGRIHGELGERYETGSNFGENAL